MNKVYTQGHKAFKDGVLKSQCPYSDTEKRSEWFRGWERAANGKDVAGGLNGNEE